jgi:hypothetical protein
MRTILALGLMLSTSAFARPPGPPGGPGGEGPPLSPAMLEEMAERETEMLEKICSKEGREQICEDMTQMRQDDWDLYLKKLIHMKRMHEARGGGFGPGGHRPPPPPMLDDETRKHLESLVGELHELARGYADVSVKEQASRKQEMLAIGLEVFEIKQTERKARLEHMRERLAEMEAEIQKREGDHDALIEEHINVLIEKGPPPEGQRGGPGGFGGPEGRRGPPPEGQRGPPPRRK